MCVRAHHYLHFHTMSTIAVIALLARARVELIDVSYVKRNCTSLCIHSPPYMVLCAVHVVLRRPDPSQGDTPLPVHMCSHLTILALNLINLFYLLHGATSIMSVCLPACRCCRCCGYYVWLFFALLCEQKLLQHETTSDPGLQSPPLFFARRF